MLIHFNKKTLSGGAKENITKRIADSLHGDGDVAFAYLHGSFVTEKSFRDIDVAVYLFDNTDSHPTLREIDMEVQLEKLAGYPVDVRILNSAPLSFQYQVIKKGRLLCARDDNLRVDFQVHTLKTYFDFEPFRRRYMKEVLKLEI